MSKTTTNIVRPNSASHWYKVDDKKVTAFHSVPYAGKRGKDGETRKTTLRDARKVGAFPSVTNVLSILHKEFLEAYKINQAILASLTLPRIDGESEDEFARRIVGDSKEHASSAARLGSSIHEYAAKILTGEDPGSLAFEVVEGRNLLSICEPMVNVINGLTPAKRKTDKEFSEFYVAHNMGYAGTCDALVWLDTGVERVQEMLNAAGYGYTEGKHQLAVVDIKSRGSEAKKAPIYETDLLQLAAYLNAVPRTVGLDMDNWNTSKVPVANLLLNTSPNAGENGVWSSELVIHHKDDVDKAWEAFTCLHKVWTWMKNYNPLKETNNNNKEEA